MKSKKIFILIWFSILLTTIGACSPPEGNKQINKSVKSHSENTTHKGGEQKNESPYPFKSYDELSILDVNYNDVLAVLTKNGVNKEQYFKVQGSSNLLGTSQSIWLSPLAALTLKSKNANNLSEIFIIDFGDYGAEDKSINKKIAIDLIELATSSTDGLVIYEELKQALIEDVKKRSGSAQQFRKINGVTLKMSFFNVKESGASPENIVLTVFKMKE